MGKKKRYYKKRHRGDTSFDLIVGLIFVAITYWCFKFYPRIATFDLQFVAISFVLLIAGVAIFLGLYVFIKKIIAKIGRRYLYRRFAFLAELSDLHPKEFENYIAAAFENNGYTVDEVTPYVGDHGIDVKLSRKGKKYAVQVKRYGEKNYVKAHEMRDFYGSYVGNFDGGIFVTTGFFGKQAVQWAKDRNIKLIDGQTLFKMMNGSKFTL